MVQQRLTLDKSYAVLETLLQMVYQACRYLGIRFDTDRVSQFQQFFTQHQLLAFFEYVGVGFVADGSYVKLFMVWIFAGIMLCQEISMGSIEIIYDGA